ncbi:hypothetical protein J7L60_01185 [Candidatus Bathyarchaeota archaeon]|nr:hypothetical protein [Candidatus Bathyarchaeota archaeon]
MGYKERPVRPIDPRFLDFINYGICKALSERYGKEAAAEVFRRAGEIEFEELKKIVEFKSREPYEVLRTVGKFLEEMGYMAEIRLTKVEEDEVIIEMSGVSVIESSIRLTQEGASPSHIMTNLMFAALKDLCNLRADIIDLTLEQPSPETGYAKEKWVLRKIE